MIPPRAYRGEVRPRRRRRGAGVKARGGRDDEVGVRSDRGGGVDGDADPRAGSDAWGGDRAHESGRVEMDGAAPRASRAAPPATGDRRQTAAAAAFPIGKTLRGRPERTTSRPAESTTARRSDGIWRGDPKARDGVGRTARSFFILSPEISATGDARFARRSSSNETPTFRD